MGIASVLAPFCAIVATLPALGLAQGATPAASAPSAGAARASRGPDLRTRANAAVHALRAAQGADGSYGGDVQTTGLALFGFARMVRQYREADGPFVAHASEYLLKQRGADGSFGTPAETDRAAATAAAALALDALEGKKYASEVAAAAAFIAKAKGRSAPARTSGFELEAFVESTVPELLPRVPADKDAQEAALSEGLQPNLAYDSIAKTASRLVLINRLAALAPSAPPESTQPDALPPFDPNASVDVAAIQKKAIEFLLKRQMESGGFGSQITRGQDLGVTALVAQALWCWPGEMPAPVRAAAEKATEIVAAGARPDGSIHGGGLENYTTSASLGALVRAKNPKYDEIIKKAKEYISGLQADAGEKYSEDHWAYGGWGYGNEERPDLSNTQMAMDALRLAGTPPDDPAMRRALVFLQRCQNRTDSNHIEISRDGVVAVSGNDGGGVYYPGKSQAGSEKTADGKEIPRSYGSMTYALLKGFVFAGLPNDDPRLKDAFAWCQRHYTLDRVPGYEEMAKIQPRIAYQGLFYYYLTLATALSAFGTDVVETPDGVRHAWRKELASRVASLQKVDGSFVNSNSQRWFEGDEVLATAYAVLVLDAARQ
ncbi:MAG: hypothetical protein JNJ88_09905 [Planctomycetes bacterium]|nr:hypothetical protein [Planctomycetota bacterium]